MARTYNYFTEEEKTFLKENYLFLSDKRLGTIFNRTEANIRKARQLLGLKRRGTALKDFIETTPVIIWMPRTSFEDYNVDLKQLKIKENK